MKLLPYNNLTLDRANLIYNHYKDNDFIKNNIKFNIYFGQLKNCNILEYKTYLSNKFGLPIIYDFEELRQ